MRALGLSGARDPHARRRVRQSATPGRRRSPTDAVPRGGRGGLAAVAASCRPGSSRSSCRRALRSASAAIARAADADSASIRRASRRSCPPTRSPIRDGDLGLRLRHDRACGPGRRTSSTGASPPRRGRRSRTSAPRCEAGGRHDGRRRRVHRLPPGHGRLRGDERVYLEFFPADPPARATLAVSALPRPAALVEIKCSARRR